MKIGDKVKVTDGSWAMLHIEGKGSEGVCGNKLKSMGLFTVVGFGSYPTGVGACPPTSCNDVKAQCDREPEAVLYTRQRLCNVVKYAESLTTWKDGLMNCINNIKIAHPDEALRLLHEEKINFYAAKFVYDNFDLKKVFSAFKNLDPRVKMEFERIGVTNFEFRRATQWASAKTKCAFNPDIVYRLKSDYVDSIVLKPCPFCGSEAVRFLEPSVAGVIINPIPRISVVCSALRGGCGSSSGYATTDEEAAKSWNNRE